MSSATNLAPQATTVSSYFIGYRYTDLLQTPIGLLPSATFLGATPDIGYSSPQNIFGNPPVSTAFGV
jgi:hypothetical protein